LIAPITIAFRHLPRSSAVECCARGFGLRLQSLNARVTACHIVLEGRSGTEGAARQCSARIHLSVPGAEIHAESATQPGEAHGDAVNALREAYEDAKRQLARQCTYSSVTRLVGSNLRRTWTRQ
jgi:hypothetical protein